MKIDLEADSVPALAPADVCIVGAGVAGLILANALARKGLRVDVLEAGGDCEEENPASFIVDCPDHRHVGATEGRCRVFGGTSARWGGQLLPFGPEVFSSRSIRAGFGWPIPSEEIYHHTEEVMELMGVNDLSFDSDFPDRIERPQYTVQTDDLRVRYSKWAPFSRRNLARTLGKTLEADSNVRIILHASAVSIEMDTAGERVEALRCRTQDGREVHYKARVFVLASGTIETVRLLLCSRQRAQMGIGNAGGHLGRHFHDHLGGVVGEVQAYSARQWEHYFAPWWIKGVLHTARLEAHPHLVAEHNWLDVMACFTFATEGTGFERFRQLLKGRQRGQLSFQQLLALLFHPQSHFDLLRLGLGAKLGRRRLLPKGARAQLHIAVEQEPVSSIRLASDHDAFGMPRAVVDWRVSQRELQTIFQFREFLRRSWNPAWGDILWHHFPEPETLLPAIRDTFHMMGGARMGTHEHNSVVGPDLKVHGVENLYLASCATFPSGGSSNPTFTLMCLCLRLAKNLERTAQERPVATPHKEQQLAPI